jgi:hypothetical protein
VKKVLAIIVGVFALLSAHSVNADNITIADSVADFGSQGEDNWYYGYTSAGGTGFTLLPKFSGTRYYISDYYWTELLDFGGLPNGNPVARSGKSSEYQSVVRRWVSEADGEITISGLLKDINTGGGDGVIGRILIDGVQVWSKNLPNGGSTSFNLSGIVQKGDNVDFYIDPKAHDAYDNTDFKVKIMTDQPTSAATPEPATMILLGTGIIGLAGMRKKSYNRIV